MYHSAETDAHLKGLALLWTVQNAKKAYGKVQISPIRTFRRKNKNLSKPGEIQKYGTFDKVCFNYRKIARIIVGNF